MPRRPALARSSAPALALALLLSGAAPTHAQFDSLCFPRDQFRFQATDKYGVVWRWDLSTLCKPTGTWSYSGFGTEGQTFYFNVGGNSSIGCSDYLNTLPMYESWGVATQMLQKGRGENTRDDCLRDDGTTCTDWTYGGDMCCSPLRCEVVALEAAVFSPLNATNFATGGVLLKHAGYPGSDNDFLKVPRPGAGPTAPAHLRAEPRVRPARRRVAARRDGLQRGRRWRERTVLPLPGLREVARRVRRGRPGADAPGQR
jgi:hypothetical protein